MEKAIYIISIIVSQNLTIESEPVEVFDAYGRILLEDIHSKCNVPSFKTSAKNGYAIIVNDGKNKKKILKAGTVSDNECLTYIINCNYTINVSVLIKTWYMC